MTGSELHRPELLRQAQEKDGNSGYETNGKTTSNDGDHPTRSLY